jgi:hypothetical protein
MEDVDVAGRIKRLADEEHALFERGGNAEGLEGEARARLRSIEVELDQCYDLLRQRRARREAGLSPEGATVRDPETVEGYLG